MATLVTQPDSGTDPAPEGYLYVCLACGKFSTTRYGFDGTNARTASPGWDESCVLNAMCMRAALIVWNDAKTRVVGYDGERSGGAQ